MGSPLSYRMRDIERLRSQIEDSQAWLQRVGVTPERQRAVIEEAITEIEARGGDADDLAILVVAIADLEPSYATG